MTNVDYKLVKNNIIKSCVATKDDPTKFYIDFVKLKELVEDLNIVPVNIGMEPHRLSEDDIPYMVEYFNKSHVEWLSKYKHMTTICFVDMEYKDDKLEAFMEALLTDKVDDPSIDKTEVMAQIAANYPCYFATIVSYQNTAPNCNKRPYYEIACRANKVVIKMSDYKYYHKDF